jgi:hypothetical protein
MRVIKSQAQLYQLRSDSGDTAWADITLVCGKKSVSVTATSDYGTFDYYWNNCGGEPKAFLCNINFPNAMKHLTGNKLYLADPDGYPGEIKQHIIDSRQNGSLTNLEARTAWTDMMAIVQEFEKGDLLNFHLYKHELFEKVFGDLDSLPNSKVLNHQAISFWDDIWIPFVNALRLEISESVIPA